MTSSPEGFPPQDLRSFLELCAGEWLALRSHFDLSLVEPDEPAKASGPATSGPTAPGATAAGPDATVAGPSDTAAGPNDTPAGPNDTPAGSEETAAVASSSDSARTGDPNPGESSTAESRTAEASSDDGLPDFAALLAQARAGVEEAPSEEAWHCSERAELQVGFLAPAQADQPGGLRVTPPGGSSRELHFRRDGSFAATPEAAPSGRWQLWPDGSVELTVESPGRVLRERIWFTQPNLRLRSSVEHRVGGRPGRARFSSEIRRVRKPAA